MNLVQASSANTVQSVNYHDFQILEENKILKLESECWNSESLRNKIDTHKRKSVVIWFIR